MNAIISSFYHFEHFVLNHSKIKTILSSTEKSPALLIILVFRSAIIRMGELSIAVDVLVTFICDVKVMATAVGWS